MVNEIESFFEQGAKSAYESSVDKSTEEGTYAYPFEMAKAEKGKGHYHRQNKAHNVINCFYNSKFPTKSFGNLFDKQLVNLG